MGELIAEANRYRDDPESLQLQEDLWALQDVLLRTLRLAARQVLSEISDRRTAAIVLGLWIAETAPNIASTSGALSRLLVEVET